MINTSILNWLEQSFQYYKYVLNPAVPGTGKTHTTQQFIITHLQNKWVVIVPNYALLEGAHNWAENLIELQKTHHFTFKIFRGRNQPSQIDPTHALCSKPEGERYYPGCQYCEYKEDCEYQHQFIGLDDYDIILTVVEQLHFFPKRNIVFDESFDLKMMATIPVDEDYFDCLHIDLNQYSKRIFEESINDKFKFPIYTGVTAFADGFEVVNEKTYFLKQFLDTNGGIFNVIKHNTSSMYFKMNKTRYEFYARQNFFNKGGLNKKVKIIFNCATTPLNIVCNITETKEEEWSVFKTEHLTLKSYKNKIFKCKGNWGKDYSSTNFETLQLLLSALKQIPVFIATKYNFEKQLDILKYSNHTIRHFGKGRGDNSAEFNNEGYYHKVVVLYGRFGLTSLLISQFNDIGFTDKEVSQMELSEMIQTMERSRLRNHKDAIVISFSDRKLFEKEKPFPMKVAHSFESLMKINWELPKDVLVQSFGSECGFDHNSFALVKELMVDLNLIRSGKKIENKKESIMNEIIEARKDTTHFINQADLAKKYGVKQSYVSKILNSMREVKPLIITKIINN